ncbi:hypothetical protein QTI66_16195 [Variovorax sp. J22R133]|uniref:hypothetical protein n=1 Tax=Variovorax brevis TaxID=3053503 RepID=UPI00257561F7|nr:hypothetical protein [Variovorax sp. J22R133]MDM0113701.1 hypothetical protein [Variovorax sp. J22R133]
MANNFDMKHPVRSRVRTSQWLLAAAAFVPAMAAAQSSTADPNAWRFALSVYGYLPSLGGSSSFPTSTGGASIDVNADKILDSLKFTFMGSFEANNGRWGFFTDFIYLDLGGSKQNSRDFTIGHNAIPASTSADLSWDLKGVVWTLAGEYRVAADPKLTVDVLGGARMFQMKPSLRWNISGDLGPISPGGRSGFAEIRETVWDAIVGAKGRYALGDSGKWFLPFYIDVGTGQSRLTWQAAAGISYAFSWGELTGMWRYLDYDMKSGNAIDSINFNGPMLGATFRW